MTAPRQLALDLGHRPALGRSDFLVSTANRDAVAWIDRWPDWPGRVLGLYGPPGCGKSHLVRVFAARSGASIVAAADLALPLSESFFAATAPVAIEDGEGVRDERALLHAFNALRERGLDLLLSGRESPARWSVVLPDLSSRLRAVTAVGIAAPDDDLLAAVVVKLFADRQLQIAPDVVTYLIRRIDRSFDAARRVVAAADADSLAEGRAVTIPLIRKLTGGV
jgi:chromosomal replication initiation ATPase DnaA